MAKPIEPMSESSLLADPAQRGVDRRVLVIAGGALVLFAVGLSGAIVLRSQAARSPATTVPGTLGAGMITAPPPLADLGTAFDDSYLFQPSFTSPQTVPSATYPTLPGVPRTPKVPNSGYLPGPPRAPAPAAPIPQFVTPAAPAAPAVPQDTPAMPGSLAGGRAFAARFTNPSATVPQGAVIPAVLETALDSSRPGFVRAIISRDVRSFDGTKVLIPRGSRLFGEYKADLATGQNRAFVIWQKLTRPDGVQIALNSPAADALGRSGIKGKVNTHFFQRFAGAILQSALDIGVGLATRSATGGTVVLGLPGSTTQINPGGADSIKPTLKTPQGAVVSVLVARDLDFSTTG